MGSNTIHDPTDQKTMSQHPGIFSTLTCFNDSCWLRMNFDMKLKPLVSISNYLSMHMWIVGSASGIRDGLQLELDWVSTMMWMS
jgi:hypothetical protein